MSHEQHAKPTNPETDLELKSVFFYECSSRRWNSIPGEKEVPPEETSDTLQILHQVNGQRFLVRGRLTMETPQGVLIADAVAVFERASKEATQSSPDTDQPSLVLSEADQRQFAESVAVPIVFPFLREAIHSGARKIGIKAPLLGILRPGSVQLTPINSP